MLTLYGRDILCSVPAEPASYGKSVEVQMRCQSTLAENAGSKATGILMRRAWPTEGSSRRVVYFSTI